jgi:hypothetical protein
VLTVGLGCARLWCLSCESKAECTLTYMYVPVNKRAASGSAQLCRQLKRATELGPEDLWLCLVFGDIDAARRLLL